MECLALAELPDMFQRSPVVSASSLGGSAKTKNLVWFETPQKTYVPINKKIFIKTIFVKL